MASLARSSDLPVGALPANTQCVYSVYADAAAGAIVCKVEVNTDVQIVNVIAVDQDGVMMVSEMKCKICFICSSRTIHHLPYIMHHLSHRWTGRCWLSLRGPSIGWPPCPYSPPDMSHAPYACRYVWMCGCICGCTYILIYQSHSVYVYVALDPSEQSQPE
ncbi:hypothetical protein EON63_12630 [archaeon]|nr:MAG: hypothetical protein EON63_12630 [archaeon]